MEFPGFMKSSANRIAQSAQAGRIQKLGGVEGYVFDGVDGRPMAFWTCAEDAKSAEHVHDFDEAQDSFLGVVVQGCYTLTIGDQRIPLQAGDEYTIARGVVHGGEVAAGTRTIHAFGGHRADRVQDV